MKSFEVLLLICGVLAWSVLMLAIGYVVGIKEETLFDLQNQKRERD